MFTDTIPQAVSKRLNTASARRRWFPFDDDIVDWSVPLSSDFRYMPLDHCAFSGAPWFERLDQHDRAFVERWEVTQYMRNIAHGEHLLNHGILSLLWRIDPYDPSYRYLLHEVAEECQHMAMFNEWVRHNDDIETVGTGEEEWGGPVSSFTEDLAVRVPEAFWVNVLLFEFVGDEFNTALKGGSDKVPDPFGRPMHPTLVSIGVTHTAEEARHIAYARRWLHDAMPSVTGTDLEELQNLAELGGDELLGRGSFLPLKWSGQLAPYTTEHDFDAALARRTGTFEMLRQFRRLLDEFVALGIVRQATNDRWIASGAFAALD